MKSDVAKSLQAVKDLKQKLSFEIVDSHFHPIDVMGVAPHACAHDDEMGVHPLSAGILEIFKYDRIAKIGTSIVSQIAPAYFAQTVKNTFTHFSDHALLNEMKFTGTDYICAMPIEPWSTTEALANRYSGNKRVLLLASVPIHSINARDVEPYLIKCKEQFHAVGVKLHPNLQCFNPQPSDNPQPVGDVLSEIYRVSEKIGLYLHFHAGASYYTSSVHQSFIGAKRSKTAGLLSNFFHDGKSEVFGKYRVPIVLAHLASYGVAEVDTTNIALTKKMHQNVFFDTSGVSPRLIANFVNEFGYSALIYGSDGPYNRMAYNIAFLYDALSNSLDESELEVAIPQVFGKTYWERVNIK